LAANAFGEALLVYVQRGIGTSPVVVVLVLVLDL
jgi:hypothetical protein